MKTGVELIAEERKEQIEKHFRTLEHDFSERMKAAGYSIRIFNPAGQDDIGGGCGQLWYFQEWLKKQEAEVESECTNNNPYGIKEHRDGCKQHCDDCDYYQPIERGK